MDLQNTDENELVTDRNQTWENNHSAITKAMAKLIRKLERLPSKTEIAAETGLSRQTVHYHIKEFGQEKLMVENLEHFSFLAAKVLGMVMAQAMGMESWGPQGFRCR